MRLARLSGTVGNSDNLQLSAEWGIMLPDGELSLPEEDNIIGFAGYLYDVEAQVYHVRNRYYDADLGRWLNRDPAGYVDGSNLYLYVRANPPLLNDPFGLAPPDDVMGPRIMFRTEPREQRQRAQANADLGYAIAGYVGPRVDNAGVAMGAGAVTGAAVGAGMGTVIPGAGTAAGATAGGIGGAISGFVSAMLGPADAPLSDSAIDGSIGGAIDGVSGGIGSKFIKAGQVATKIDDAIGVAGDAAARRSMIWQQKALRTYWLSTVVSRVGSGEPDVMRPMHRNRTPIGIQVSASSPRFEILV